MGNMSGVQSILEIFKSREVRYIFGNPGTSESPLMLELEKHPEIEYILVLQEGVAIGMADSYARSTKKSSIVNLHIETGLANGISLLHNAKESRTPIIVTAGNKDIREIANGRTDLAEMVRLFTKSTAEVTHPEQILTSLRKAFNESMNHPTGPVFVGFSANSLDEFHQIEISDDIQKTQKFQPDMNAIQDSVELLATATNPVILVGDQVSQSDATKEAVQTSEIIGAKVFAMSFAGVNFPTNHPNFRGDIKLGYLNSFQAIEKADVILSIGKFTDGYYMFSKPRLEYFNPRTKLIHMDVDSTSVGNTQKTEVGLITDPKIGLSMLNTALQSELTTNQKEISKTRNKKLLDEKKLIEETKKIQIKNNWSNSPMSPTRMMYEISKVLPKNAILVDDSVTSRESIFQTMNFDQPNSYFSGFGGAIGWGMGAGIGVQLSNPNNPVVCIMGDGSAMMTIQGLWTAANYNIPVVNIICNNSSYRVLKINMNYYKNHVLNNPSKETSKYIGMNFPERINFEGISNSIGVQAQTISNPEKLSDAIKKSFDSGKPSLIDVHINGEI